MIEVKLIPKLDSFYLLKTTKYNPLFPLFPTDILGKRVAPPANIKNLRIVFESKMALSFSEHVSQVKKLTLIHIKD